ncbi:unnamed protein product [Rhodiola kirilowii]
MVSVWCCNFRSSPPTRWSSQFYSARCSSEKPEEKRRNPELLKFAVSGITEGLRLLSSFNGSKLTSSSSGRNEKREEVSVCDIDDVIMILKSDYENSYFVTGVFTSAIYAEDCVIEDPTIKFSGTELYERNLKLLVPFFDNPSISLQRIEKASKGESDYIYAAWKLRTYLKLPWRPLIAIDGNTVYELDNKFKLGMLRGGVSQHWKQLLKYLQVVQGLKTAKNEFIYSAMACFIRGRTTVTLPSGAARVTACAILYISIVHGHSLVYLLALTHC